MGVNFQLAFQRHQLFIERHGASCRKEMRKFGFYAAKAVAHLWPMTIRQISRYRVATADWPPTVLPHVRQGKQQLALSAQRLLSTALIDMAKDHSQSFKQSKSFSRFNIFGRPLFLKSRSTTINQSTSSPPSVSSAVNSRGEAALGEHAIISLFVLLPNSM